MSKADFKFKFHGRLSFERLFKPRAFVVGQNPRYEATGLIDPSSKEGAADIANIKKAATDCLVAKYGSLERIPKGIKKCYGDADKDGKEYDGYAGNFYIALSQSVNPDRPRPPPVIVGPRKDPATGKLQVLTPADGIPFGGCYVNISGSFWVYDNPMKPEHGRKLLANLLVVQHVRKGEPFGVRPVDADEEFDALEESAEDTAVDPIPDWDE